MRGKALVGTDLVVNHVWEELGSLVPPTGLSTHQLYHPTS